MDVLLVDNDSNFSTELTSIFEQNSQRLKITSHTSPEDILRTAKNSHLDFIALSYDLPELDADTILQGLRSQNPEIPVIGISQNASADTAVQAIKNGAFDFHLKNSPMEELFSKFINYEQNEYSWRLGHKLHGYTLKHLISETPASMVFKATREDDDQLYAVKVIKPEELEDNKLALERFKREVDVINKMDHPNIIQIYHYGIGEGDRPYMIMPYIQGPTLADIMHDLSEEEFLDVMLSLLDTLWDVHKHNMIHRDLKPDNIMFYEGRPTLLDFGTVLVHHDLSITHENHVIGTPNYMAPETFSTGFKVDYRSDIYSFGIILYEYVYKKCPFDGESFREIFTNLRTLTNEDIFTGSRYDELLKELINRHPGKRHDSVLTISEELHKIKTQIQLDPE